MKAQVKESPIAYIKKFQQYRIYSHDVDSVLYYAKKLGSEKDFAYWFNHLIHNEFALSFVKPNFKKDSSSLKQKQWENELIYDREVLRQMMSDTMALLRDMAKPIYYWNTVQENINNKTELERLTKEFMAEAFLPQNFYKNRTGRYGLLIHKVINEQTELKPLANTLFNLIKENVINNQIDDTDSISRDDSDKRACFRYLYAYINFWESTQTDDKKNKEMLLRTAFEYSPDLSYKVHDRGYIYDKMMLSGKDSFDSEYLNFMKSNYSDKKQFLSLLLKMALNEPKYKTILKQFYENNNFTENNFADFWKASIDKNGKNSPSISLNLLDGTLFSSKNNLGKWILMDFWGTWCSPCREEHPDLQRFHDSIKSQSLRGINLITVACRDTKERVVKYMDSKNLSFPVVMADDKIEKDFVVNGYPSKILISPTGKYINIPFGVDWQTLIKDYCDL